MSKEHFKMYKDGKKWVFAAVVTALVGAATLTVSASADTNTQSAPVQPQAAQPQTDTHVAHVGYMMRQIQVLQLQTLMLLTNHQHKMVTG